MLLLLLLLLLLFLQINMVDSSPGILRVPRDRRNLDKLLREASRKRLLHTCWGKELRLFNQVDPEYFASMGSEEQRIWTVSSCSRTHTQRHTPTHTPQATKCAVMCRSRINDHVSVKSLAQRKPPYPDEPWRVDRAQVKHTHTHTHTLTDSRSRAHAHTQR